MGSERENFEADLDKNLKNFLSMEDVRNYNRNFDSSKEEIDMVDRYSTMSNY